MNVGSNVGSLVGFPGSTDKTDPCTVNRLGNACRECRDLTGEESGGDHRMVDMRHACCLMRRPPIAATHSVSGT
jgi:hypothetical protein